MIFTGEPSYIVYQYTLNDLIYIGSAKGNGLPDQIMNQRAGNCGKKYKSNPRFYEAIKKFGWANVKRKVLVYGIKSEFEARAYESVCIIKKRSYDPSIGYNCNTGEGNPELVNAILENDESMIDAILSTPHNKKKRNNRMDNEEFVNYVVLNDIKGKRRIRELMSQFNITESSLSHYLYESSDRGCGRFNPEFKKRWEIPEKDIEEGFEPLF